MLSVNQYFEKLNLIGFANVESSSSACKKNVLLNFLL